jgi:hypothetical protein
MKTPSAPPDLRRIGFAEAPPLRPRAAAPALARPLLALHAAHAAHDFLVANPRPDLVLDVRTLRMIEAG